jgi:hypothetical protein
MTEGLIELRDWLKSAGCTAVAMEATGAYWKPVYNIADCDCDSIRVSRPSADGSNQL